MIPLLSNLKWMSNPRVKLVQFSNIVSILILIDLAVLCARQKLMNNAYPLRRYCLRSENEHVMDTTFIQIFAVVLEMLQPRIGLLTWYTKCYKDAVHAGMITRTKERYEKQIETHKTKRKA